MMVFGGSTDIEFNKKNFVFNIKSNEWTEFTVCRERRKREDY